MNILSSGTEVQYEARVIIISKLCLVSKRYNKSNKWTQNEEIGKRELVKSAACVSCVPPF
jgi:hypothetical protein